MALAGLDLVRLRVAVPGRSALEDVGDVDVPARQADALQQAVEELARRADERVALLVLVEARGLADEHEVGIRVADTEDDLRPPLGQPAASAGRGVGGVRLEALRGDSGRRAQQPQLPPQQPPPEDTGPPKLGCSAVPP